MIDNIIKHNTNSNGRQYHLCCVWWYCQSLLFVLCLMILSTITVCVVFHDIVYHYCLYCVWWYCQPLLFVLCLMILSTITVCIVYDDIVNHYCLYCVWWYCRPLLFVLCLMILSIITVCVVFLDIVYHIIQTVMVDNIIKHNTNSNGWQYHQTQHKQ
jgi:hypothetical protein